MTKSNILYIEDHPDNMLLVRRILQAESYTLLEAKTGAEGLSMVESHDVDLVLLDINLPDIDGYEVARRLRSSANSAVTRLPIIAVTANALKGDDKRALKAGCDEYISKPIDIQRLLEIIRSFLPPQWSTLEASGSEKPQEHKRGVVL